MPSSVIMHLHSIGRISREERQVALAGCLLLSLLVAGLFAWIPMRLGRRHLLTRDY
jgi:uncharacterized iron-regulated membrane protein